MPDAIPPFRPQWLGSKPSPLSDAERKQSNRFYASKAWRELRLIVLRDQPLCVDCLAKGLTVEAKHVHHIVELRQDWSRALDQTNLTGLCPACHNAKRRKYLD